MGKKKFIDKKKSATFQLMARDTSDPIYSSDPSGDRVFVRVDNNGYTPDSLFDDDDVSPADPDSIFADAPEDCDDESGNDGTGGLYDNRGKKAAAQENLRREILELGFPDDGYNYLMHLREIKKTGGGSAYYQNPKATFNQLPRDVKAYDSSMVEVPKIYDVSDDKSAYNVAAKSVGVRLKKVIDPEVAALLDDSDSSKFGSDVEDLEEDFVIQANVSEEPLDEELDKKLTHAQGPNVNHLQSGNLADFDASKTDNDILSFDKENSRIRRPLDEQFDLLQLQEYGSENEEEYSYSIDENECQESLAEKLNDALKSHPPDPFNDGKGLDDIEPPELAAHVIRRCKEYGAKYENDSPNEEEVFVEESSDESEVWDCETIVSTYSTLDNHPGKIGAPEARRKKKLSETVFGSSGGVNQVIALKGKEKLPVDFLPRGRKHVEEKTKDEKDANSKRIGVPKRRPHGQESKDEKKERKSAVKLERREARQVKKEMKVLYKSESQHAQKVAAFTGPSSIHLM